jgi:hypothetical protein
VSAAKQPSVLHVVASSEEDTATRRLHHLMRQRETLRNIFRTTWDDLSHQFDPTELSATSSMCAASSSLFNGGTLLKENVGAPTTVSFAPNSNRSPLKWPV